MVRNLAFTLSKMKSSKGFIRGLTWPDLCFKRLEECRWPKIQVGIVLRGHCNDLGEKRWQVVLSAGGSSSSGEKVVRYLMCFKGKISSIFWWIWRWSVRKKMESGMMPGWLAWVSNGRFQLLFPEMEKVLGRQSFRRKKWINYWLWQALKVY